MVKLRPKEDDPKEQCQNTNALCLGLHVLNKMKLRPEWLQGQAKRPSHPRVALILCLAQPSRDLNFPCGYRPVGRRLRTPLQWHWSGTSKQVRARRLFEPMQNL